MNSTSFAAFYDEQIVAKFKPNADLTDINEMDGYFDYRCACDLCCKGKCANIKINILNFKERETFILNELDVKYDGAWYDPNKPEYDKNTDKLQSCFLKLYETTDKSIIKELYDFYCQKFHKLMDKNRSKSWWLSSTFDDGFEVISEDCVDQITSIHVCDVCYTWLICTHDDYDSRFKRISSMKVFWHDVIEEYLECYIDIENDQHRQLFIGPKSGNIKIVK